MTKEELLKLAKFLEGKTLGEISDRVNKIVDADVRKFNKSVVSNIIESDYFKIPINSSEDADFSALGVDVELKVSPLKLVRGNIFTTKERNVLKMVDYFDIYENPIWTDTKLQKKLKSILFVMYHHNEREHPGQWKIISTFIWELNPYYHKMIEADYNIIRENVINGVVLSEKQNTFLATCPKHGGGYNKKNPKLSIPSSLTSHPILNQAEKRGYCIKQAEFTRLICRETKRQLVAKGRTIGFYQL
jgi:DNA mismatch repair protein MutH